MSTNLAALVAPFVTSVVLGKDVVPRVSVANLGRLIDQMVRARHMMAGRYAAGAMGADAIM